MKIVDKKYRKSQIKIRKSFNFVVSRGMSRSALALHMAGLDYPTISMYEADMGRVAVSLRV